MRLEHVNYTAQLTRAPRYATQSHAQHRFEASVNTHLPKQASHLASRPLPLLLPPHQLAGLQPLHQHSCLAPVTQRNQAAQVKMTLQFNHMQPLLQHTCLAPDARTGSAEQGVRKSGQSRKKHVIIPLTQSTKTNNTHTHPLCLIPVCSLCLLG